MEKDWLITIDDFNGFAPAWWGNNFPTIGDNTQARDMVNVDLFFSNGLTQGIGIKTLTEGDQSGGVATLINQILDFPTTTNITYGVGGNLLYYLTNSAITNSGIWPHTIDKAVVTAEDGESVCYFRSNLYYSYNHSGTAGDIGKYDMGTTFDDDYMSTTPTGAAALEGDVPHQMILGGDNKMYISNGRYVASFDGTTFVAQALDLPTGLVISSIAWNNNRLYAAVNKSTLSGDNKNLSSIYTWDTTSPTWEMEIPINGRLGATFVKDGVIHIWWEELVTGSSVYKLGYIDGGNIVELIIYSESSDTTALPSYGQVTDYKNCLIWSKYENVTLTATYNTTVDDTDVTVDDIPETVDNNIAETNTGILAFGSISKNIEPKFFQCIKGKYANLGAIANPFGTLLVASYSGSNYNLSKGFRYSTEARWKTIYFNVSGVASKARIKRITVFTDPMLFNAALDTTLQYDFGKNSVTLDQIAYSTNNETKHIISRDNVIIENFALDFSWANGSITNPVKIRKIEIAGVFIRDM